MAYEPKDLGFLYSERPPEVGISDDVRIGMNLLPTEQRNLFGWMMALSDAFWRERTALKILAFQSMAIGFADPVSEHDGFAAVVFVDPLVEYQRWKPLDPLKVGTRSFPIIIRRSNEVRQGPAIHPIGGRSTCWASSQRIRHFHAFLTADHVVKSAQALAGNPPAVPLGQGVQGTVIDTAPSLDVALVELPQSAASSSNPHSINPLLCVPAWIDATLLFASGSVRTKVMLVTDTQGNYNALFPVKIWTDKYGQAGDSGSLLLGHIQPPTGTGTVDYFLGLYQGVAPNGSGQPQGFSQNLAQVTRVMNLTLLD